MTTTFFLVRHAAHDNLGSYLAGRTEGIVLGPDGRAQARRLAERMRRERFAAIVSSPRERTRETAGAISQASAVGPVEIDEDLDEIDFGAWSGKTFVELHEDEAWRRWNAERDSAATPSGETMKDVGRRVGNCIQMRAAQHAGEAIVLVSHADVIKSAVAQVLGLSADRCQRFDVDPASITVMVVGEWGSKLLRLNESV